MKASFILLTSIACASNNNNFSGSGLSLQKRHNGHHHEQPSAGVHSNSTIEPSPASSNHHHGRPILENPHLEPQQRKYWEQYSTLNFFNSEEGNKFWLWSHVILTVVSLGLMAPVVLLMSNNIAVQWFYVPLLTIKTCLTFASSLCLAFYSTSAPDLYPGNFYGRFYALFMFLTMLHWISMIVRAVTSLISEEACEGYTAAHASHLEEHNPDTYMLDNISENDDQHENQQVPRQSTSSTVFGSESDVNSYDCEEENAQKHMLNGHNHISGGRSTSSLFALKLAKKLAKSKLFVRLNTLMGVIASFIHRLINYPMFLVDCATLLLGLSTGFCMGKGHNIFGLLAHFIKGFVFFILGFVELARFLGIGASRGWSWNEKFITRDSKNQMYSKLYIANYIFPQFPTFEFFQSFLIFFYGCSNIFLEHLGNTDGVWSHKDLQHASIAFLFIGGGLCGLILEADVIKKYVAAATGIANREDFDDNYMVRRSWSINPMPAFTIFWTGALMSKHHQETELSTQIHVQWGTLLSVAALLRFLTLAIMIVKPRSNNDCDRNLPQKPFTEVLVAFCLVCGGLIFMASNRETVEAMIYRGIDQMFSLNVSVGFTAILLAYFTGCVALKGWAISRY